MLTFAKRNLKEILRDVLTAFFGLLFPLFLLCLLRAIGKNVPAPLFEIEKLAPGICVFAQSFLTLFCATLVAKDRKSLFFERLYTTPLTATDFVLGYTLPFLLLSLLQTLVCYGAALLFGLEAGTKILFALLSSVPTAVCSIALGLLAGSVLDEKQVGGICGALLTNVSAFLSGAWMEVSLIGGVFEKIANFLPFLHETELSRAALAGDASAALGHLWWVLGWGVTLLFAATFCFVRQMKKR